MNKTLIIVALFFVFGCNQNEETKPSPNEKEAPNNQTQNRNDDLYFDKNGFEVFIQRYPNGKTKFITQQISQNPKIDVTTLFTDKGHFIISYKEEDLGNAKYKMHGILPPEKRPQNVPKDADFDTELLKWTTGKSVKNIKQGKWKLWWPDGKDAGWVEFDQGKPTGNGVFVLSEDYKDYLPYRDPKVTKTKLYLPFFHVFFEKWNKGTRLKCNKTKFESAPHCEPEKRKNALSEAQ